MCIKSGHRESSISDLTPGRLKRMTTASSYVWWTVYTLVAVTSFGMLLALDGFFGTPMN